MPEERRTLDYIAPRSESDSTRIADYSISSDSSFKFGLPAVEAHYRAVTLYVNCLWRGNAQVLSEIHSANLIPFIRAPKLLMHGRYDEGCRLKSETKLLIKLLREPKRMTRSPISTCLLSGTGRASSANSSARLRSIPTMSRHFTCTRTI
jgi:hypothetical protein